MPTRLGMAVSWSRGGSRPVPSSLPQIRGSRADLICNDLTSLGTIEGLISVHLTWISGRENQQALIMKATRISDSEMPWARAYEWRHIIDNLRPQTEAGDETLGKIRHSKTAVYKEEMKKATHRPRQNKSSEMTLSFHWADPYAQSKSSQSVKECPGTTEPVCKDRERWLFFFKYLIFNKNNKRQTKK